jgi:hypothetical protein
MTRIATVNRTRTRSAHSIRRRDENLLMDLAREMLGVCMDTLRRHGIAERKLRKLAAEIRAGGSDIPASTKLFQDVSDLGKLASEWAENDLYVDGSGRPRVIPIVGPLPSFSALVQAYFPGRAVSEILQIGIETKVVERVGTRSVGHLGACVLLTGNQTLLLAHAVRSIKWFLSTTYYNAQTLNEAESARPERQAFAELSESDFDEFQDVMREPIVNLTEMCNRWLMTRSSAGDVVAKKIIMGLQAYIFKDI